ncbi:MAG: EamA family transporter [Ignavibacteria bacterium]|jgi:transporter family protein|nr:EamA family transporter [Ignavibacteria bacterium]MDH7527266.1 EamA family transporter [Ignavibacteria bacterium]
MKQYILFATLAGVLWGIGGYFEKAGLREMGMPPIAGITIRTLVALLILGLISIPSWSLIQNPSNYKAWLMIIIGGGIVAGSFGMWSFYTALAKSENLGVTLAIAFAMSPVAGTLLGLIKGTQEINWKITFGILFIVIGIILVQLSHKPQT